MKFYIFTKKRILTIIFLFISICATLVVTGTAVTRVVTTATEKKEIPIYYVDKAEKTISISFDAAWGNEQTQELLNILDECEVKSTFFLVGGWIDKYPESVKAIADAGHDIGNHSNTHPYMTKLSTEKMQSEIQECNNKAYSITGVQPILFRPPYGDYNNSVVSTVRSLGMHCIQWDVDSLDWKDPSVDEIREKVVSKVKNGSIVLFHNGAKNTPQALPIVIKELKNQGYNIVPISQLIYQNNYTTEHDGKQISLSQ